ncbi:site-specific DNA-methyltransferase [Leptotrichia sp. HSP-536]|uniref:Site-specific DNA-methyltransferase n=1 Tax=Leptotrichia alba TaxID=3239304 RepID=A0AB39V494_9FUSO
MENNKIKKEINDIVNDNLKVLEQLFPSAVKDGQLDVKALKEELGEFEEVTTEKYELNWAGKQNAKKIVQQGIGNKTLKFVAKDSKNADTTENIYIEGDNLEVLKLLRQNYYNSIKMIYIDPPYNTGNDFVYNDTFKMDKEESDKAEGIISENNEKLQKNQKSTNRYHANWLNMMYPRLKLARDLLTDDGVIFISIDDNEQANLKRLCDEIFGEENFVAQIIWERAFAPVNLKKHFSESHDYIVCYSKNINLSINNGLKRNQEADNRYSNPDDDSRGVWTSGDFSVGPAVESNIYKIVSPSGRENYPPNGRSWRVSEEKFKEMLLDNRVWFGEDGNGVPRQKRFLSEVKNSITPMTIWKYTEIGHSQDATKKLKELFDEVHVFDYSKTVELIKRCIELYTNQGDIVLDFFSGSATTAHAVMQLNSENNKNRKFIMAQLPEITYKGILEKYENEMGEKKERYVIDITTGYPIVEKDSEARKAGFYTIAEIGKERIRRAGEKIKKEIEEYNSNLKLGEEPKKVPDIGFKAFKVDDTNIKWYDMENFNEDGQYSFDDPDSLDFVLGSNDIDIIYEIMLRQNDVPLSEKIEFLTDIGNRTYLYAGLYLICLETEITEEMVEKLASLDSLPIKFIFRDSAFKDNISLKDETFRKLRSLIERNSGESKVSYRVEFI